MIRWRRVALHLVLILTCLWILAPLAWLFLNSVDAAQFQIGRKVWPDQFADPLWARYRWMWQNFSWDQPFYHSFRNSVMVTSMTVVAGTISAVLAGYALAILKTPGRLLILAILVSSLLFPTRVTAITGYFKIFHEFDLIGKTWSLFMPYTALTLAISIFVMRGVFQMVNREIIEAATLDGAGSMRTLMQIVLPIVRNGIVIVAVLNFSAAWGEYVLASVLMNDWDQWTLAVVMGRGAGGSLGASVYIVAIMPALILLGVTQHWVFQGLQEGATTG